MHSGPPSAGRSSCLLFLCLAGFFLALPASRAAAQATGGFIEAAGKSDAPEVPRRLLDILPLLTPNARSAGLSAFLSRADWTDALLDALSCQLT